ncbi:MAG: hypothetical protein H6835_01155 [Planctomycetes bacterium]|nr:hypothetical protein [Planctomycetota bacterium]
MRWAIAGLLFALMVALTLATAALRADNVRARKRVEGVVRALQDRKVELTRLSMKRLDSATPQHLAELQWRWLQREAQRRAGGEQ